jgi:GT2 family glycosyltransferase
MTDPDPFSEAEAFPTSLILSPTSRWPTKLPEATVHAILSRPLPNDRCPALTPEGQPRVSIVVVTFNSLVFTRMCLESVLANTDEITYEVLVVDNASTDDTPAYLENLARLNHRVRLILNLENRGFAPANNQALALAAGEILVLLNNDTIVPPGWLRRLIRHLDDEAVGLVGPVTNRTGNEAEIDVPYKTYGEMLDFVAAYVEAHIGELFDIRMVAMFCVALRRTVFERLGPLDESFQIGLFEDDDYSQRVRAAGYRVVCAEDVFVHHFGQASLGHLASGGEYGALFHENRRRWEAKWRTNWEPYQRRIKPAYQHLTQRIREAVRNQLPSGETILVASKGDEELLDFDGRPAWHFPQSAEGGYAGYHPADSHAAIDELESLRSKGAAFFLLPATSLWWLDFYGDFQRYLESNCTKVLDQKDVCLIYDLRDSHQ